MSNRSRYTKKNTRIIPVQIGDETHYLAAISESERADYEASLFNSKGKVDEAAYKSQRRRLLVLVLSDKDGKRLFKPDEHELLKDMDAGEAAILFSEAQMKCLYANGLPEGIEANQKKSGGPIESDSPSESA